MSIELSDTEHSLQSYQLITPLSYTHTHTQTLSPWGLQWSGSVI